MKITCVQSLAPGALPGSMVGAIVNVEDDSTNESGVEIIDSLDSSYLTDQKSGDEIDSPLSPDPEKNPAPSESPQSPDAESPQSPSPDDKSPQSPSPDAESPQSPSPDDKSPQSPSPDDKSPQSPSPDVVSPRSLEVKDSPQSPEVKDSPESPEVKDSPESPEVIESSASPEVINILEFPASPPGVGVNTIQEHLCANTHVRRKEYSFSDVVANAAITFTLDSKGDKSSNSSELQGDADGIEIVSISSGKSSSVSNSTAISGSAQPKIFGQGLGMGIQRKPEIKPVYSKDIQCVLDVQSVGISSTNTEKKGILESMPVLQRSCFNCLGDHVLRNCPKELNRPLIAKRRREFKSTVGNKEYRYHEQTIDTKYSDFQPGIISQGLRSALGLRKNELPGYIYRMRKYGYPPGYFRQALESATGLAFYGGDTVRKSKSKAEIKKSLKEKLINYPGFTTPAPSGYTDDGDNRFEEKYTIENIANSWYQDQCSMAATAQIKFSTATQARCQSLSAPQGSKTTGASASRMPCLLGSHLESANNISATNAEPNWYDDLFDSTHPPASPARRGGSDVREVEKIYQRVVERRRVPSDREWTDLEYENRSTVPRNYRITEQLEIQEEERKKLRAIKQKDEDDRRERERELDDRPTSPSLLNPDSPSKFNTNTNYPPHVTKRNQPVDNDDDVMIVEDEESTKNPRKRRLEEDDEIITISSDDEDDMGQNGKMEELVPNPLYKKLKMAAENDGAAGNQRITATVPLKCSDSLTISNKTLEPAEATYPWAEGMLQKSNTKNDSGQRVLDASPKASEPLEKIEHLEENDAKKKDFDKAMLLSILKEDSEDGQVFSSYSDVPPIANFSKDMPPLPLQDEATAYTGRLQKVLSIIHDKKGPRKKDEDDDIQIIE